LKIIFYAHFSNRQDAGSTKSEFGGKIGILFWLKIRKCSICNQDERDYLQNTCNYLIAIAACGFVSVLINWNLLGIQL
jgi:hypothetical protein